MTCREHLVFWLSLRQFFTMSDRYTPSDTLLYIKLIRGIIMENMNIKIENEIRISEKLHDELKIKTKIFFTVLTVSYIGYRIWI